MKNDRTAMMLDFDILNDKDHKKAIEEINKIVNKYNGRITLTKDYCSEYGGVTIYQP